MNLEDSDTLVSFDIVSLFPNVLVQETLEVISKKLHSEHTVSEHSTLSVEANMKLLRITNLLWEGH
jgi:hypothetical protein